MNLLLRSGWVLALAAGLAPAVALPCTPAADHACVTHDNAVTGNNVFWLDVGAGPVQQLPLALTVGTPFTFELDVDGSDFTAHPFVLTTSRDGGVGSTQLGASDGVSGTNPDSTPGTVLVFSPTQAGTYYYQCDIHYNEGAAIVATGTLPPPDSGSGPDAGPPDAGVGAPDSGTPDSGTPDSGTVAPPDAGGADAGSIVAPDAGAGSGGKGGCSCDESPAPLVLWGLLLAAAARRRVARLEP